MPYAVGLLTADRGSDLMDPKSWTKSPVPVFKTCAENGQYGPGHNSFTKSEDDSEDLMIYHARNYTEIKGDPLFDPNRHARVGVVRWNEDGTPDFGVPEPDNLWTPPSRPTCCRPTAVRKPAPRRSGWPQRHSRTRRRSWCGMSRRSRAPHA